jgi:hypothetical protein
VPLEKRTRVEIFLPIRSDLLEYRAVTEWLAEELAIARGGSTLTTPFTGLYLSDAHGSILRDSVQVLFCDFDLDPTDSAQESELVNYLKALRLLLMEILFEEEVWIVHHSVYRVN